ncbi:alpha-glucoside-specific PTS transporter subunit IIBC [Vibrio spartinae]|uniref:PTS system maltose-specific EIICB component n=1 Tax=Vibrio spartinae TaxID=1918945 RepID=A0ABX6R342_9VIBR|nr:alpha-glucoside-specific PTS transporter subunit IIBC [Vibrio spartinae]QMV15772.1 PTS system maltose-specific EIICB component [Vibrio spartinae]
MLSQIQRFGGAMFTPVLLFPFAGIIVGLSIVLKNPDFMGSLADTNSTFFQLMKILEEGGWTIFRNMPLIFAIALPIGLAQKAHARACLVVFLSYLTYNYFIAAMATVWGSDFGVDFSQAPGGVSGLTLISGIKTLDTSIVGAILIASLVTYLHNRFFDTKLPDYLGIFQGTAFIAILAFFAMLPCAWATLMIWPKVQAAISSLQGLMLASGTLGVWLYTFLERVLIPTGLHHFIYGPFIFGPVAVENGIMMNWAQHIQEFSQSTLPLKTLFPSGGFALHGNSKLFGSIGIALAIYITADEENKSKIAGLLIPATLTSILVGITEPLEFTFLFVAPFLFVIHAILAATMSAIMYSLGVVGNMGGGLIEIVSQNWLPMYNHHAYVMLTQISVGLCFTVIYFFLFKMLIIRFDLKTPGRNSEAKLYKKSDYKTKASRDTHPAGSLASRLIEALGGERNIEQLNNCATRLRVTVIDPMQIVGDQIFTDMGVHGVVRNGKAIQIIIGLSVPQVREECEGLLHI